MNKHFTPVAPLFATDAYKQSHRDMMVPGTDLAYSNFTHRSSMFPQITHIVNYGLQAFLQDYMIDAFEPFFAATEDEVVRLYENRVKSYLGADKVDASHIRALHRKGYIPLRFKQVDEGTMVPLKVPVLTVENTDPEFAWAVNYFESAISAGLWHASSIATLAAYSKDVLNKWADKTGCDRGIVDFQFHDFSVRGMQTVGDGATASAHLTSFIGSDALFAMEWVDYFYPGEDNGQVMASIPASEHATMSGLTAYYGSELEAYRYLLTEVHPTGFVSLVSDTYNIWNVVEPGGILDQLRDIVLGRDGKLVIRPDSGNIVDVLCGTVHEFGKGVTAEEKGVVELLSEVFGYTTNEAGYRLLNERIGVIYGDGISADKADQVLARLAEKGFASANMVFGVGSYFYGQSRDSVSGSAQKQTYLEVNGRPYNILKDPITAKGKKSATGLLSVFKGDDGELHLIEKATREQEEASELKTVWEDGKFVRRLTFAQIRANVAADAKRLFN